MWSNLQSNRCSELVKVSCQTSAELANAPRAIASSRHMYDLFNALLPRQRTTNSSLSTLLANTGLANHLTLILHSINAFLGHAHS
jgi:hypothetical protein